MPRTPKPVTKPEPAPGKAEPAAEPASELSESVEEIQPEPEQQRGVTFVLDPPADDDDVQADDDIDDEDDDDEDAEFEPDELTTAVGQLTQLMMTNDGEALTDVLAGVRDALEKQNKILYRGLQLLEARR